MLQEAELFVESERVLVEVLGRIRAADRATVLPPVLGGEAALPLEQAVERHLRDEERLGGALGRPFRADTVEDAARQACEAAASAAQDPGTCGTPVVRERLLQAAVARALLAHHVATSALGSTACPLPEELARSLWELTAPDAAAWRARGHFREPLPLPPHVSWRDRFLRTAGHDPHPAH